MKLTLGTVQFGLNYGVQNSSGIPDNEELAKIFNTAEKSGINTFDTAQAYGNAEERIAEYLKEDSKVISKFKFTDKQEILQQNLESSLSTLKLKKLYGYMAHNADNLIQYPSLWDKLLENKGSGLVNKIGYSLYNVNQLENLLDMGLVPDIVQLPYSLLDRKFEPMLGVLKNLGVEVHARSVFLQGLYFMDPNNLPLKLTSLKICIQELNLLAEKFSYSIAEMALNFVINHKNIDMVVIGIDTEEQLKTNIGLIDPLFNLKALYNKIEQIAVPNPELLNPSNW
ncbi:MAG: aldo/keto reductase [Opitutaceae bacterium]|nr:aldo/keto reductase [Cytophagales bacterium]